MFSLFINGVVLVMQPASLKETVQAVLSDPRILFLNTLPIFLLILMLFFITNRVALSIVITSNLFFIFSIISRLKIIFRNEPFVPSDFFLGGEGVKIFFQGKYEFDPKLILYFLFFNLLTVGLIFLGNKVFRVREFEWKYRPLFLIGTLILAVLSYRTVFTDARLYAELPVSGNIYNEVDNFNSKGSVYCFLYNFKYLKPDRPENYNAEDLHRKSVDYLRADEAEKSDSESEKPSIVMIMGEAFTDISENDGFEMKKDPLRNFKKLKEEAHFNGHIITPTFGGGTADTEFDSVTGMMTAFVTGRGVYSYRFVRFPILSVIRQFANLGYHTVGMHPGFPWFYNRENVYEHLDFKEKYFNDSFKDTDLKGQYISEKATYQKIFGDLDRAFQSDQPLFYYTVTIQNHGPYAKGKYTEEYPGYVEEKRYTQETKECLDAYFYGIDDMDRELGQLRDYLSKQDRPVILVYYGDHLPFLGDNHKGYQEANMDIDRDRLEGYLNFYKTPFLVWGNSKAQDYLKKIRLEEEMISANYLGSLLLDPVLESCHPFYQELSEMRKEMPVMTARWFKYRGDWYLSEDLPSEAKEKLQNFKAWEYYLLNNALQRRKTS